MDALGLRVLRDEMLADCRVALDALEKAHERFDLQEKIAHEACAHQLSRMYNGIEQMGLRVAKAFENNIDDDHGWHGALLSRLSISIEDVRPALFPSDLKTALRELKAFRHVFVHAYELELDPAKLKLLLKYADEVGERLTGVVQDFVQQAARELGLE